MSSIRLFRNTALRSLPTPVPLPSSALHFHPAAVTAAARRAHSTQAKAHLHTEAHNHAHDHAHHDHIHAHAHAHTSGDAGGMLSSSTHQEVRIEPRLALTFTCTVSGCGHRSTHQFTKHAYEKGIVLIECPGCKNRHLIADHLGWFKESTHEGKLKTVEDLMRARGETVRRGRIDTSGSIEYAPA